MQDYDVGGAWSQNELAEFEYATSQQAQADAAWWAWCVEQDREKARAAYEDHE